MKKRTIKRSILSALVVTIMLMATSLTACSSRETTETSAKEETTKAEVTEETNEAEQTEEAATPEPTEEAAPEPETENSKYPGIDMESTLPGIEWLDTFDGIINEPKLVVFNDETNKKVIVENGDTIEFSLTDTMATYVPADKESYPKYLISRCFKNYECVGRYTIETELQSGIDKVGVIFNYSNIIIYGDDEVKLIAEIKIVE
ncbi:MAG: hypothetical protein MR817_00930 [Lachnospiraceae bacterium]|nr:hypothetical protein [Lachnospiraceae bacterium]